MVTISFGGLALVKGFEKNFGNRETLQCTHVHRARDRSQIDLLPPFSKKTESKVLPNNICSHMSQNNLELMKPILNRAIYLSI